MSNLNVYCWNFSVEEIEGLSVLREYSLKELPIDLENRGNLEPEVPAIFVFRNAPNDTRVWKYIHMVRARKMNAAFLLLFSKKDFALLYGACQNGITAVQMEPASRRELEEQLARCLQRITEVTQNRKDREQLEEYEFEKHHKIMERLLANILERPEEMEALLPEINKRYGTKLGKGCYQVFTIGVDRGELCGSTSHFLKEVTLMAIHTLGLAEEIILGYKEQYGLIGIVYYGRSVALGERRPEYFRLWKQVMSLQEYYGEFVAVIGVGAMVDGIAQVWESLIRATFSREYYMVNGECVLLAEEKQAPKELSVYVPERNIKELMRHVTLGEVQEVQEWFAMFYEETEPKFLRYPPAYGKFCYEIYHMRNQFKDDKNGGRRAELFPDRKFYRLQHTLDGKTRIRELEELLLEICHIMQQDADLVSDVAAQAIAYMKMHYNEPINLDYMAEKCGFSTSYFSRKFKEQTGEKYIDVLTDIRVREAQRLLEETDLSVLEIVEEVGYCDDKHFRRVFHKHTGMNPLEYRKEVRGKAQIVRK